MGNVDLDSKEVNIFHKYPLARCIAVFLFVWLILVDTDKNFDPPEVRLLGTFLVTMIYAIAIERKSFEPDE